MIKQHEYLTRAVFLLRFAPEASTEMNEIKSVRLRLHLLLLRVRDFAQRGGLRKKMYISIKNFVHSFLNLYKTI